MLIKEPKIATVVHACNLSIWKPRGKTRRTDFQRSKLGGYGEVPALGLFRTNMPVYAETGERAKPSQTKGWLQRPAKWGWGLCADVSFKCCLHLYLILATLNVLL